MGQGKEIGETEKVCFSHCADSKVPDGMLWSFDTGAGWRCGRQRVRCCVHGWVLHTQATHKWSHMSMLFVLEVGFETGVSPLMQSPRMVFFLKTAPSESRKTLTSSKRNERPPSGYLLVPLKTVTTIETRTGRIFTHRLRRGCFQLLKRPTRAKEGPSWWTTPLTANTIRKGNYIDPLRLERAELFSEVILTANVNSSKVKRGRIEKEMNLVETSNASRGSQNTPYNKELQDALNKFVQKHPEYQQGKIQERSREDMKCREPPG